MTKYALNVQKYALKLQMGPRPWARAAAARAQAPGGRRTRREYECQGLSRRRGLAV